MKTVITIEEKKFDKLYAGNLQRLQNTCNDDSLIYTKIPFSFAIKHNLSIIRLMFHPEIIGYLKPNQLPDYSIVSITKALHNVILFELTNVKSYLSKRELLKIISCYRSLTNN